MNNLFELSVILGRFDPLHIEHLNNYIIPAYNFGDALLILMGCSSEHSKDKTKLDFISYASRKIILSDALKEEGLIENRVTILPILDAPDKIWINNAESLIFSALQKYWQPEQSHKITFFSSSKNDYSEWFPKFYCYNILMATPTLSATTIREAMLQDNLESVRQYLPASVYDTLKAKSYKLANQK